jgi:thioredoxin reductase (NADPH)
MSRSSAQGRQGLLPRFMPPPRGYRRLCSKALRLVGRGAPKITVYPFAEITALEGDTYLREVSWTNRKNAEITSRPMANLFVMIGADPNTEWLNGCLSLDAKGFVETGREADGMALASPFATTKPGVFAAGDVRAASVKRVAYGVGEGSVVVQAIHPFLNPASHNHG